MLLMLYAPLDNNDAAIVNNAINDINKTTSDKSSFYEKSDSFYLIIYYQIHIF